MVDGVGNAPGRPEGNMEGFLTVLGLYADSALNGGYPDGLPGASLVPEAAELRKEIGHTLEKLHEAATPLDEEGLRPKSSPIGSWVPTG